ncbi:hypothetical protein GCM10011418_11220 [Sphingobacterium alkalisoli]|nr:hypothetical protein GCM10011418_11220 [Sphingobacterium alkalisoli]
MQVLFMETFLGRSAFTFWDSEDVNEYVYRRCVGREEAQPSTLWKTYYKY